MLPAQLVRGAWTDPPCSVMCVRPSYVRNPATLAPRRSARARSGHRTGNGTRADGPRPARVEYVTATTEPERATSGLPPLPSPLAQLRAGRLTRRMIQLQLGLVLYGVSMGLMIRAEL